MSEHTKEPWVQGDCSRNMIYAWKGQVLVFTDDGYRIIVSCNQNYPEEAEANARRIVACVNACTDMKDPAADIDTIKAQRDELLAAANGIDAWWRLPNIARTVDTIEPPMRAIIKAIANAEKDNL